VTRWTIDATWVPRGALIRDGFTRRLAETRSIGEVREVVRLMRQWARESTCGGSVLIEVREGDEVRDSCGFQVQHEQMAPIAQTAPGYPAHECGAPMVMPPRGSGGGRQHLYCTGCGVLVEAPAVVRMKATAAGQAERAASRGAT
jgi:hypothetical protein